MRRILDLDWDFFVCESPVLMWDHAEWPSHIQDIIWLSRTQYCVQNNQNIVDICTPMEDPHPPQFFYHLESKGYKLSEDVKKIAALSHKTLFEEYLAWIKQQTDLVDIWHFDAHHDLGYENLSSKISCDNGLFVLAQEPNVASIHVVYPNWRKGICPITYRSKLMFEISPNTKQKIKRRTPCTVEFLYLDQIPERKKIQFDLVGVAKSPEWSPPWMDLKFGSFLFQLGLDVVCLDGDETIKSRWPVETWAEIKNILSPNS